MAVCGFLPYVGFLHAGQCDDLQRHHPTQQPHSSRPEETASAYCDLHTELDKIPHEWSLRGTEPPPRPRPTDAAVERATLPAVFV